jgi:hypothetical protein
MNLSAILAEIERLDDQSKLTLLAEIALLLRDRGVAGRKPVQLSSLSGLGSSVWSGTNIDEYVHGERQW